MHDVIIIGAGPAGMTAALYLRRASRSVLLIECETFGGQITYSPKVENYPGYSEISGNEFGDKLFDQICALGAEYEFARVTSVRDNGATKTVYTEDGQFESRSVIIATGSKHRKLGIENEEEYIGSGVSYCAICDGAFYKGKSVAVVGGGSTAVTDAVYLSGYCEKVYLIHRRSAFRAEPSIVDRLKKKENIELLLDSTVTELIGDPDGNLCGVIVESKENGRYPLMIEGLFVAVGMEPQNRPFDSIINLDSEGYADSFEDCRTRTPGVFVAGDCRKKSLRQLTTAVSDGSVAASAAGEYLESLT